MKFILINQKSTRQFSGAFLMLQRVFQSILISMLLFSCGQENVDDDKPLDKVVKITESPQQHDDIYQFTDHDIQFLKQFSLSQLGPPPVSASNAFADNESAALLGKKLFFDTELSRNKQVSCATCHKPELYFTDGLKRSIGVGVTRRSSPTVLGTAYSSWQFWDGRKDSLWSQALGPIEDPNEYATTRVEYVRFLLNKYADEYQKVFGETSLDNLNHLLQPASPLGSEDEQQQWKLVDNQIKDWVNRVFSNAGKAMMAYQQRLTIQPTRFDQFIDLLVAKDSASVSQLAELLSPDEVIGLRLFVGKANCASCHNGPLFTNYEFHNIGAPDVSDEGVELGRYQGVKSLLEDEFTCLSEWSDAKSRDCQEMRFLKKSGSELVGALKTPSLRNITATAPYMQFGQFKKLKEVIAHYNDPPPPVYNYEHHPSRPHFDIIPLKLTANEMAQLESFLGTLLSPISENDPWWQ